MTAAHDDRLAMIQDPCLLGEVDSKPDTSEALGNAHSVALGGKLFADVGWVQPLGFGSGIAYVGIAGGQRQLPADIGAVGRIAFLHAKRNPSHKSGRKEAALIACGAGELIV